MTIEEMQAQLAKLETASTALREQIQANTDAARKFNEQNRMLIEKRKDVQKAIHSLSHDIRKAEKEAEKAD